MDLFAKPHPAPASNCDARNPQLLHLASGSRVPRLIAVAAAVVLSAACGSASADGSKADNSSASAGQAASASAGSGTSSSGLSEAISAAADSGMSLVQRADEGRLMGDPNAMWVVMLSDYQCPFCKQWHDSSMARLEADYIRTGKVRFAYVHLPLASIHPHAVAEAEAAMCASAQGRFWQYSDALFAAQPVVRTMSDVSPLLNRIARDQKLDLAQFELCRKSPAIRAQVQGDIRQAEQAKIVSTPTFIIGQFMIPGAIPYPDFAKAIDTALVLHAKQK